jgi:hypothetical protein
MIHLWRSSILVTLLLWSVLLPQVAEARPKPPGKTAPARASNHERIPVFAWKRSKGAETYEVQIAADRRFGSLVGGRSIETRNRYLTLDRGLADGTYYWRLRGVDGKNRAGKWSKTTSFTKSWATRARLLAPADETDVRWPGTPLVLRWSVVPQAVRYEVVIATDPTMAAPVLGSVTSPVTTVGTVFAVPGSLAPGRYYWSITPVDAGGFKGVRSAVGTFIWSWPTQTTLKFTDLNDEPRFLDPQLSWTPVPGAAQYEVEVNYDDDFAPGSKVCCATTTTGLSLSPVTPLVNNRYHWRVRALDAAGNAGVWNGGPDFDKDFDNVVPTVPNLHIRDIDGDPAVDLDPMTPVLDTSSPIITWDEVPGASGYELDLPPHNGVGCLLGDGRPDAFTPGTVFTPDPRPYSGTRCVRVRAVGPKGTAVSDWTQIPGPGQPGFRTVVPTDTGALGGGERVTGYRLPVAGSLERRVPLFTWTPLAHAGSYWVFVARDALFTEIVEKKQVILPAYAPTTTYEDEDTSYYWAVVPADGQSSGSPAYSTPLENSPTYFDKRSDLPIPLDPPEGSDVPVQPTFRWTSSPGAYQYRLQVSADPTFADRVEDVTTGATAYTTNKTLPVDTLLYWRVRATDADGVELGWSQPMRTFRRRLPVPVTDSGNPTGGTDIPVLAWSPVQGAVSYGMHVEQADGSRKDFVTTSTSLTPTTFYGTGIWRWSVRANYPGGQTGAFSAPVAYTRRIDAPGKAVGRKSAGTMLLSWEPYEGAKSYRVQISSDPDFRAIVESGQPQESTWAPKLTASAYRAGGKLYWRVAATDEGGNVGAWSSGKFTLRRALVLSVRGSAQRGRRGRLRVSVKDLAGRRLNSARVVVRGAGAGRAHKRTRKGTAAFTLRPRKRGNLVFTASKRGYRTATARVAVR